jgi:YidC/Oxa1 family membrane protein insertase
VRESGYELDVETDVRGASRSIPFEIALGAGIGDPPDGASSDFRDPAVAFPQEGSIERYYIGDLEDGSIRLETAANWTAIDSKYFALVLHRPGAVRNLLMGTEPWTPPDAVGDASASVGLVSGTVGLAASSDFTLFVGPKKKEELSALDPGLGELINYGWFGPLVKPLLAALKWINGSVNNWGWSIIILTFLINLALFPIRYKQMASMSKMSALQPKLKSIQDKYKRMKRDDPRKQQMNTEVMALYKEHGVNPLGGCLPLLLQMPILFAFFRMLDASIELRGAPFIFWIQDLSKADPYYITPIVMGISMVAQQKMTPATGDPTQRKMMMFLPVVFTFFFLNFSSGLVVYFLFSNLFAMMLQLGMQKFKPELAKKPAGKKAGKPKK